jgi:hypothetical protein
MEIKQLGEDIVVAGIVGVLQHKRVAPRMKYSKDIITVASLVRNNPRV